MTWIRLKLIGQGRPVCGILCRATTCLFTAGAPRRIGFISTRCYYEGFGNAFLEAIYFGRPVVVNTYAVYARDIDPFGFKSIEVTQLVTRDVVEQVRAVLHDPVLRED